MAKKKGSGKEKKSNELPRVHKELEGFDIRINSFGEITSSFDMDKINEFLNRNVEDKKLRDRSDIPGLKGEEEPSLADEDSPFDEDDFSNEEE